VGSASRRSVRNSSGCEIVAIRYILQMPAPRPSSAATLQSARRRAGLTQAELGRRAGVPQSVVSAYESGRREPSFEALVNLLGAAGFELTLTPTAETTVRFAGPVGRRLQRRRSRARELLESRGYRNPTVFGSVARNTDTPESDVDLLVDLPEGVGLYELNRMAIDLEALIGAPVDLIPRDGLRPRAAADAGADLVPL
jgi:uncharacterized protein